MSRSIYIATGEIKLLLALHANIVFKLNEMMLYGAST